ncbi:sensor histidine kinase [Sphingomonas canadensis]|uniref:Sensor histidine kinase n=1 Tax=Sphingomonas canadensis TaxID=1219257 RepID=A0ABW3H3F1_9SPHN|nr:ATP-binding protein [Sphingomonas canadensis]MCW3834698.1 ATP-binding protein [Sphingomonas canadensis]
MSQTQAARADRSRFPLHSARARAAGCVLVIALVQLVFWLMVSAGESAVRPGNLVNRPSVEYELLDAQGKALSPDRTLHATFENTPNYSAPVGDGSPYAVFHIDFDRPLGGAPLAFFLGATPGLKEIRLNGTVIQPNVPLNLRRGAAEGEARYYMLPPANVRPKANRIDVFVETQSAVLVLSPFSISPALDAAAAAEAQRIVNEILPTVAVSFLAFAILLSLAINWPAEDRRRVRALRLLMVLWLARSWFITFSMPFEIPFLATYLIYYLLEIAALMSFARYIAVEQPLPQPWARAINIAWGLLSGLAVATAAYGLAVGPTAQSVMKILPFAIAAVTVPVAIGGFVMLAYSILRTQEGRRIEHLVLMLCLTGYLVDAADSALRLSVPFQPDLQLTFYTSLPLGLLLGLGVVASIAREASEARRVVVKSNAILAERLAEQDAELSRSYDAQKQMLQRQVMLEERQRIVRDMHDGIGGQLLGLMMQVRNGAAEPKLVEQGLQSSIADLRLIVDAMDTAEEGLAETLRSFEHRVRAQVEAAGIGFSVSHGLDEGQPGPGARPTLQILRVLQESVTNAMRHSGAAAITLASGYLEDGRIRIVVGDNGRGIPEGVHGGRGMTSMRSRAAAVGGEITVETGETGTTITLTLPPAGA